MHSVNICMAEAGACHVVQSQQPLAPLHWPFVGFCSDDSHEMAVAYMPLTESATRNHNYVIR